jgi:nitroimidazol reductase NimA-like FMN-containing flavoprotein (pyridoxamine 5'-phosphate oxidase superfamily)
MNSESDTRYLMEATVPLRLASVTSSGWPIVLSLWYTYQDGKLYCAIRSQQKFLDILDPSKDAPSRLATTNHPIAEFGGEG